MDNYVKGTDLLRLAFIRFAVAFIFSFFIFEPISYSWTVNVNFESGTNGQLAQGISGFTEAGSRTTFSSEESNTGNFSAKMAWRSGSTGWGECHGYVNYPSTLHEGDEIWVRGYFYFKSPWSWQCSPRIKVLRGVHIRTAGGSNVGYLSVFAKNGGEIVLSNEVNSFEPGLGVYFDLDRWQCIEMYVKLSTTNPVFRIWKDGILIAEDTSHKTLRNSNDVADFSYIMTYWNGGAPQDQIEYVDDLVYTTETPSNKDAQGNPMIGPDQGSQNESVPSPPSSLRTNP